MLNYLTKIKSCFNTYTGILLKRTYLIKGTYSQLDIFLNTDRRIQTMDDVESARGRWSLPVDGPSDGIGRVLPGDSG